VKNSSKLTFKERRWRHQLSSLITTSSQSITVNGASRRNEIDVDYIDIDSLVEMITGFSDGANVGIVCSTVRNASSLHEYLAEYVDADKLTLVHSRFVAVDRVHNDAELLKMLGKHTSGSDGELRVVVGTQIIEQSLDIDFDVMVSEIAPVDALLQRMGRLHRHSHKTRPDYCKQPRFLILEPDDEIIKSQGGEMVYQPYPLRQSEHIMKSLNKIVLPDDIFSLVEQSRVVHMAEWDDLKAGYLNAAQARKSSAKPYLVAAPHPLRDESIHGWLDGAISGNEEFKGSAKVRDGISGPTIIAVFEDDDGIWVPVYNKRGEREKRFISNEAPISWNEAKDILGSSLSLPIYMNSHIDVLETEASLLPMHDAWQQSSLLKGEVSLLFSYGEAEIGDKVLSYEQHSGLKG